MKCCQTKLHTNNAYQSKKKYHSKLYRRALYGIYSVTFDLAALYGAHQHIPCFSHTCIRLCYKSIGGNFTSSNVRDQVKQSINIFELFLCTIGLTYNTVPLRKSPYVMAILITAIPSNAFCIIYIYNVSFCFVLSFRSTKSAKVKKKAKKNNADFFISILSIILSETLSKTVLFALFLSS